jgi:hypothetical protein
MAAGDDAWELFESDLTVVAGADMAIIPKSNIKSVCPMRLTRIGKAVIGL